MKNTAEYGVDEVGEYIIVEHSAGARKPNKVKKYRGICNNCGCDRGWIFKAYLNYLCSSCSLRLSYKNSDRAINQNDMGLKCTKFHNGKEIELKSSYEIFFFNHLKELGDNFEYEPEAFLLPSGETYRPDFLHDGVYYELKGVVRDKDVEKFNSFVLAHPNKKAQILLKQDLHQMGYDPNNYSKLVYCHILKTRWSFIFMDFKQYGKKHGSKTKAVTCADEKAVYFNIRECDIVTIRHELAHVYSIEMGIVELQLEDDQIEELFCELIGRYSHWLFKQAKTLNGALLTLKDRIVFNTK